MKFIVYHRLGREIMPLCKPALQALVRYGRSEQDEWLKRPDGWRWAPIAIRLTELGDIDRDRGSSRHGVKDDVGLVSHMAVCG